MSNAKIEFVLQRWRSVQPPSTPLSFFDDFVARHRPALEELIGAWLTRRAARKAKTPEAQTAKARTARNLAAMHIVATRAPTDMTADERRAVLGYSGWGGLSIEGVADQFPPGLVPSEFALVHEYYTPTIVADAIADLVCPLLPELAGFDGVVRAFEPNVGIGRLVRAMGPPRCLPDEHVKEVRWTAVELSEVSAKMFAAMRPDVELFQMSTERWMSTHAARFQGKVSLVLANPPYGQRGEYALQDPSAFYKETAAYAYVMRRSLDLLVPRGFGAFIIPAGFLEGSSNQRLREKVLLRHHLEAAFRLPSELGNGKEMFPGAGNVVDVLFWRSRGGELQQIDPADAFILEGNYYKEFPTHVLGVEVDKADEASKAAAKLAKAAGETVRRLRYRVVGDFTGFPAFTPRPICSSCAIRNAPALEVVEVDSGVRAIEVADADTTPQMALALELGRRVDRYLALVAAEDIRAVNLWSELRQALEDFRRTRAVTNPWAWADLREFGAKKQMIQRLLGAFQKGNGELIPALQEPPQIQPKFAAASNDVVAQAEHLFRTARRLSVATLEAFHAGQGGVLSREAMLEQLLRGEWNLDGEDWDELLPTRAYLGGKLWPRYDRARTMAAEGSLQAVKQLRRLDAVMNLASFEDITDVSPRQGWVPLELVSQWISQRINGRYGEIPTLIRLGGTVQLPTAADATATDDGLAAYKRLGSSAALTPESLWCLGWINHDFTFFKPDLSPEAVLKLKEEDAAANGEEVAETEEAASSEDDEEDENLGEVRLLLGRHWDRDFHAWVRAEEERRAVIRESYNRAFRGVVIPTYDGDTLEIARWNETGPRLKSHQIAGARRVLDLRRGLIAFDVGVGKTYTAIAVVAAARQEGWVRRPVVLVPSSLVWKWEADFRCVLPDYRVCVIGSNRKVISRGERKGFATSDTDTPEQRSAKWTDFQAGLYDVVILSYDALGRTRLNQEAVISYLETIEGIKRQIKIRQRNAEKKKADKMTERDRAILKHGARAFVEEILELPKGHKFDPGVAWDDIGIDMLVVDEAANFKNSYKPENREHGTPKFMGNAGDGSKRAWQLDFRAAAVRQKTGGSGIVLLSATPAKNSPLEFYNMIQLIDPYAFSGKGLMDPEMFIDRFLRIVSREIVDMTLGAKMASCVDGFKNLDDLRLVIKTYGEFRSGEEVGLKMPEPRSEQVKVAMNETQEELYRGYRQKLIRALSMMGREGSSKSKVLGLQVRMAMVALHPALDGGVDYDKALNISPSDYSAPKLEACAELIAASSGCGHIIFCEPTAVQLWMKEILVKHKIPRERIAILNAIETAPADRVRIAREFNGTFTNEAPVPGACGAGITSSVPPKYDVVIANSVAYEGIDLQVRTCTIHHLDLPWTPADLEQRNGRAVRQGNLLPVVSIYYYLTDHSLDWYRYQLIQGKRQWLGDVLSGQRRETSNPGAQDEMSTEEIMLANAGSPGELAQLEAAIKMRKEGLQAQARGKLAREAANLAVQANARFRDARESSDPEQAARLRAEAEQRLKDLRRADPAAWPWVKWVDRMRDTEVVIASPLAPPVFEGLRVRHRSGFLEFGRVLGGSNIGCRKANAPEWQLLSETDISALNLQPADLEAGLEWPDEPDLGDSLDAHVERIFRRNVVTFDELSWTGASDEWLTRWWPRVARDVQAGLQRSTAEQVSPLEVDGALVLLEGEEIRGQLLPPTFAGWRRFLELAPKSEITVSELRSVAKFWWQRKPPRGFLAARKGEQLDEDEPSPSVRKAAAQAGPLPLGGSTPPDTRQAAQADASSTGGPTPSPAPRAAEVPPPAPSSAVEVKTSATPPNTARAGKRGSRGGGRRVDPPTSKFPPSRWADRLVDMFNTNPGPQLRLVGQTGRGQSSGVNFVVTSEDGRFDLASIHVQGHEIDEVEWLSERLRPSEQDVIAERLERVLQDSDALERAASSDPDPLDSHQLQPVIDLLERTRATTGASWLRTAGKREGSIRTLAEALTDLIPKPDSSAAEVATWLNEVGLSTTASVLEDEAAVKYNNVDTLVNEVWSALDEALPVVEVHLNKAGKKLVDRRALAVPSDGHFRRSLLIREPGGPSRKYRLREVRVKSGSLDNDDPAVEVEGDVNVGATVYLTADESEHGSRKREEYGVDFIRSVHDRLTDLEYSLRRTPQLLADVRHLLLLAGALINTENCQGREQKAATVAFDKAKRFYDAARQLVITGKPAAAAEKIHQAMQRIATSAALISQDCAAGQQSIVGAGASLAVTPGDEALLEGSS